MAGTAKALKPLYRLDGVAILLCGTIHTDDTPVKVRDTERKIKVTARLGLLRLLPSPPSTSSTSPCSHKCATGRAGSSAGFRGFLRADAFSGYDGIYAGGDVVEVGFNAQCARKFIEGPGAASCAGRPRRWPITVCDAIEKRIKAEIAKLPPDAMRRPGPRSGWTSPRMVSAVNGYPARSYSIGGIGLPGRCR